MKQIDTSESAVKTSNQRTTAVREVVIKYRGPCFSERPGISDQRNAATFLKKVLPDNSREHFVTIYLDGAHTVIGYSLLTGVATSCVVHPREVFQPAILLGAVAVLICHNHPSGNIHPSEEDNKITRQLVSSAEILGLKLLDHIILGDSDLTYSYAEHGLL